MSWLDALPIPSRFRVYVSCGEPRRSREFSFSVPFASHVVDNKWLVEHDEFVRLRSTHSACFALAASFLIQDGRSLQSGYELHRPH
ncbi:unnamed protein product [Calypogeia fissa]